jgi:FkbM family methyltransferase
MEARSYSQLGQEIHILSLYQGKRNGTFVEVGANDGILLSNTKTLEEFYGWKGLCVEPNPDLFPKLVANRPLAQCSSKAAYSKSGLKLDFQIGKGPTDLLSGLVSDLKDGDNRDALDGNTDRVVQVETATLTELMDEAKMPRFIEYLSLDTEGSELEVLKGIDFGKYAFGRIDVEHNFIEPHRTQMREFLASKGYTHLYENKWDDAYIHSALLQKQKSPQPTNAQEV